MNNTCKKIINGFNPVAYIFIVSLFLTNCTAQFYRASYDIKLSEVERPSNFSDRYSEIEISKLETSDKGVYKYQYEDSLINIIWIPYTDRFNFALQNKSNYTMKIIWDNAAFVDMDGKTERVSHLGVKYVDMNQSQPPTIIARNSRVEDSIIPVENVYYYINSWQHNNIYPMKTSLPEVKRKIETEMPGKILKVLLPIEIENTINDYMFIFKVDSVSMSGPYTEQVGAFEERYD